MPIRSPPNRSRSSRESSWVAFQSCITAKLTSPETWISWTTSIAPGDTSIPVEGYASGFYNSINQTIVVPLYTATTNCTKNPFPWSIHSPVYPLSQGNRAPKYPVSLACLRATSNALLRPPINISPTCCCSISTPGYIQVSWSQNTWPQYWHRRGDGLVAIAHSSTQTYRFFALWQTCRTDSNIRPQRIFRHGKGTHQVEERCIRCSSQVKVPLYGYPPWFPDIIPRWTMLLE